MIIARCPACDDELAFPEGVSTDLACRCPLCGEEFDLATALSSAPPRVLVSVGRTANQGGLGDLDLTDEALTPDSSEDEERWTDDWAAAGLIATAAGQGQANGVGPSSTDPLASLSPASPGVGAVPAALTARSTAPSARIAGGKSPPTKRKSARREVSAASMVIQAVLGGVITIPATILFLWWVLNTDVAGAGPMVAQYVPWIVPEGLRGTATPPTGSMQPPRGGQPGTRNGADPGPGAAPPNGRGGGRRTSAAPPPGPRPTFEAGVATDGTLPEMPDSFEVDNLPPGVGNRGPTRRPTGPGGTASGGQTLAGALDDAPLPGELSTAPGGTDPLLAGDLTPPGLSDPPPFAPGGLDPFATLPELPDELPMSDDGDDPLDLNALDMSLDLPDLSASPSQPTPTGETPTSPSEPSPAEEPMADETPDAPTTEPQSSDSATETTAPPSASPQSAASADGPTDVGDARTVIARVEAAEGRLVAVAGQAGPERNAAVSDLYEAAAEMGSVLGRLPATTAPARRQLDAARESLRPLANGSVRRRILGMGANQRWPDLAMASEPAPIALAGSVVAVTDPETAEPDNADTQAAPRQLTVELEGGRGRRVVVESSDSVAVGAMVVVVGRVRPGESEDEAVVEAAIVVAAEAPTPVSPEPPTTASPAPGTEPSTADSPSESPAPSPDNSDAADPDDAEPGDAEPDAAATGDR